MNEDEQIKKSRIRKSKIHTNSSISAAWTIDSLYQDTMDLETLIDKMEASRDRIAQNNIEDIEAMLITQAHTLNVLFHRFLTQVGNTEFIPHLQVFSDIALRAQKQCKNTLVALADIKNPRRATFVKQQNNAINQQVNNQSEPENNQIHANELLEVNHGQRLDTRTTITPGSNNTQVETMEACRRKDD